VPLQPVAGDLCHACRPRTAATFAGLGTATVYDQDDVEWLVIRTATETVAAKVYENMSGCAMHHCVEEAVAAVSLRAFRYRAGRDRVIDVGLELDTTRVDDFDEDGGAGRVETSTAQLFYACGKDASGPWACRPVTPTCDHATWARTAEPAVISTCVQRLGR
jgi:hypothetical protein